MSVSHYNALAASVYEPALPFIQRRQASDLVDSLTKWSETLLASAENAPQCLIQGGNDPKCSTTDLFKNTGCPELKDIAIDALTDIEEAIKSVECYCNYQTSDKYNDFEKGCVEAVCEKEDADKFLAENEETNKKSAKQCLDIVNALRKEAGLETKEEKDDKESGASSMSLKGALLLALSVLPAFAAVIY